MVLPGEEHMSPGQGQAAEWDGDGEGRGRTHVRGRKADRRETRTGNKMEGN